LAAQSRDEPESYSFATQDNQRGALRGVVDERLLAALALEVLAKGRMRVTFT
jgi:hypothetical protein